MKKFRKYRMVMHVIFNSKEVLFKSEHPAFTDRSVWVSPHGNLDTETLDYKEAEKSAESIIAMLLNSNVATVYIYEELHMKTVCIFSTVVFVDTIQNNDCIKEFSTESFDYFGSLHLFPKTKRHSSGKHLLLLVNETTKTKKYLSLHSVSDAFYAEYLKRKKKVKNDNKIKS